MSRRFAYADPPYLGQGASRYGHLHPEAAIWDDPATHRGLVDRLEAEYPDGWAASLQGSPDALDCYLRPGAWLAVWVRPEAVQLSRPTMRIVLNYEFVVFRTTVPNDIRFGPRVHKAQVLPGPRWQQQRTHTGTKPPAFCRWVLDLLGYRPGIDQLDDLFPGEGSMTAAAAQLRLPSINGHARPIQTILEGL